jgi:hypothetical protein
LLETKIDSDPQIFTVPDRYILKYEEVIAKWKVAGISHPGSSQNPVNMVLKQK